MKLSRLDKIDLNDSGNSTGSYIEKFNEAASTGTNLKHYGVSFVPYSSAANSFGLDAPVLGISKTIILDSTVAPDSTAITTVIDCGSEIIKDDSTTYNPKRYISFQPPYASIELEGLSTANWGVRNTYGAVQLTTAVGYTT